MGSPVAGIDVNATTTMTPPLTSGDSAYWPQWVNICLPVFSIIVFLVTVILSLKCGSKSSVHMKVPVINTMNDVNESNNSIDKKSDTSDNAEKRNEECDKVSMLQKAKEQAKNSRAAKRLSSIRSRVSSSSQYDYSPLDEGLGNNQIEQDSSDDEDVVAKDPNTVTVDVEHHSPPRNALISSEDSGFTSIRTSSSENV